MNDTIILTGAAGFTGQACHRVLSHAGYDIVPVVRSPAGYDHEIVLDFEADNIAARLSGLPPCKAVVHLASHVDFSSDAADSKFFSTNILATALLSQFCKRAGGRFILASGVLLHGLVPMIDAATPVAPINAYGRSKLLAEQIVAASGVFHTVLRIAGIFGRHGPSHLGLNRAIDGALDDGVPPVLIGSGLGRRNYIYVRDMAEVVLECIDREIDGTHLVAGPKALSIEEMLLEISNVFIPEAQIERKPGGDSADAVVTPSVALSEGRGFRAALLDIKDGAVD